MKKKSGLLLLVALVAVFAVGCGDKTKKDEKNTDTTAVEEAFKVAGTQYFEDYMKGVIGQDYNEITLEMLENVNEKNNAGYDLSKLSGCSKDSKITIQADENRNIVDYQYELNCK